ncbi:putative SOS response-associated peptidase YedK [Shewanella sp. P1-14-1]|uniref:SOS response-associated peptidase n=1 Tax=Shewanella sp. P1-14-1 TaxID=1723761 RepID=UPI0006D68BC7|nr:SOS response-associated peptidase family protein [Shewanella sp. P1-14-1]KPZ68780.1 putative SOS response-associated peptidase YedK [Shewanella sp. P1-14-1]
MCGRIEVLLSGMQSTLDNLFEQPLTIQDNLDLRPTDPITTLSHQQGKIISSQQRWGIQPDWTKKLIINAQAETVSQKPTFSSAFAQHRCIIPCSGWFEWRQEPTTDLLSLDQELANGADTPPISSQQQKHKYRFSHAGNKPLFMAGVMYPDQQQVVTLTIKPNTKCAQYHHRMPLFIASTQINHWLTQPVDNLSELINPLPEHWIKITDSTQI